MYLLAFDYSAYEVIHKLRFTNYYFQINADWLQPTDALTDVLAYHSLTNL